MVLYNAIQAPKTTQMQVLIPNNKAVEVPHNPNPFAAELEEPFVPIDPPVPVGAMPLGRFDGFRFEPRVTVVGFGTAVAEGIFPLPEGMAWTLLAVALNFVGAMDISWLS